MEHGTTQRHAYLHLHVNALVVHSEKHALLSRTKDLHGTRQRGMGTPINADGAMVKCTTVRDGAASWTPLRTFNFPNRTWKGVDLMEPSGYFTAMMSSAPLNVDCTGKTRRRVQTGAVHVVWQAAP